MARSVTAYSFSIQGMHKLQTFMKRLGNAPHLINRLQMLAKQNDDELIVDHRGLTRENYEHVARMCDVPVERLIEARNVEHPAFLVHTRYLQEVWEYFLKAKKENERAGAKGRIVNSARGVNASRVVEALILFAIAELEKEPQVKDAHDTGSTQGHAVRPQTKRVKRAARKAAAA